MRTSLPWKKSNLKPSRVFIVGFLTLAIVVAGIPFLRPEKTSASGTRPTLDTSSVNTFSQNDTVSQPLTITSTNNPFLVVTVAYRLIVGDDSVTSMQFNGTNMDFVCRANGEGYVTELWTYSDPPAFSDSINISWSNDVDDIIVGSAQFSNVDNNAPITSSNCVGEPFGFSTAPTATLTTANNYSLLWASAAQYTDSNTLTLDGGATEAWNTRTTNVWNATATKDSTGGSDTISWTADVDWQWSTAALELSGIASSVVRGTSGDLWADKVIGRRDFGEIVPGLVDANHVYAPGGVVVDPNYGTDGIAYVWDSQNSRIVGVDLGDCYSQSSGGCSGSLVIGQPSLDDHGACDLDSSFSDYPYPPQASADTLCGMEVWIHTVLEDKTFTQMYFNTNDDSLYVYDDFNNRVLRYDNPANNDSTADQVWGQPNFTSDRCNQSTNGYNDTPNAPTADTLCFFNNNVGIGAAVQFDPSGNMWVVDGGNNRILRFPDTCSGICSSPDIVLGQQDFTHGTGGNSDSQLQSPSSIAFDSFNEMIVADTGNGRVQVFCGDYTTGMDACDTITNSISITGNVVEVDNAAPGSDDVYISSNEGYSRKVYKYDADSGTIIANYSFSNPGGGGIGFDPDGNILVPTYVYGMNVTRLTYDGGSGFMDPFDLFVGGSYHVDPSGSRFGAAGWVGVDTIDTTLFAAEGRLLFWNNKDSLTNGQAPDGYLGGSGFDDFSQGYGQLKHDGDGNLYAARTGGFDVFEGPDFVSGDEASVFVGPVIDVLGGGTITLGSNISGIAVDFNDNVWLTDTDNNRIVRVTNVFNTPVVDAILGQTDTSGTDCNRGGSADLDTICTPGTLSIDHFDNLYVSDDNLEVAGNLRLLMFRENTLPFNPGSVIYAPAATKQFNHATFEVAFDSSNRMYAGYNPYVGSRFVEYYNNPMEVNPADPTDQAYAQPDGHVNDFSNWVVGMTVDQDNNLWTFDANRGRLLEYLAPRPQDTTAPTINITSPADNANVSGTVDLAADASDNFGVAYVQFLVYNGVGYDLVGTDYTAPYTASFDSTPYNGMTTNMTAMVTDVAYHTTSDAITLNFSTSDDTTPPTVSITSPTNNQTVSGTFSVTTDASDDVAVDHVKLFVDGSEYSTVSNSPFNFDWDTTGYANNSMHTLQAQAFDTSGNNAYSTVINAKAHDNTPPTGSITSPGDGGTVSRGSKVTITADASDNGALNRVDFYVNGIRKCAAVSTYTCSWNVPRTSGSYTIMAKVIDSGGNITDTSNITVSAP